MKKFSLLAITLLIVIAGCKKHKSTETDPDHIKQDIYYTYESDNLDSKFSIRFFDTDWYNRVKLLSPASVTLNGHPMSLDSVTYYYYANFENDKVASGLFTYTDIWNRVYKNTADLQKSIELPDHIDTIHRDRDNVITWVGEPCGGGSEYVQLKMGIIVDDVNIKTNEAGATSITIKSGSFLAGGNQSGWSVMRIDRYATFPLQQGTQVGGNITTTFKSKARWVYVK